MKAIRLLAACMFLLTGILHIYLAINPVAESNLILMLAFGILYLATGVLLLMNKRLGLWLGLIPIIPMVMAPFVLDLNNLDWTIIWFPIELIAVICCIILLVKRN